VGSASEESRNSSDQKAPSKGPAGAKAITTGASDETDQKRSQQSDDVGCEDFTIRKADVFRDHALQERRERVPGSTTVSACHHVLELVGDSPRPESNEETQPGEEEHTAMDTHYI